MKTKCNKRYYGYRDGIKTEIAYSTYLVLRFLGITALVEKEE